MHIHYFQHDHFEDLGYIGEWADSRNFTTSVTRFDLNPELPPIDSFDWLVVLGGKMGVNDSAEFPWIADEIEFIKKVIHSGKIVIGICLGSQLVAKALGARVYKNMEQEIGFLPVYFNKSALNDSIFRHFPAELTVMHMHFDVFEIPSGATAMANSAVTLCQAFRYMKNVFAFQFHFEITESNAPVFIREITPEIVPGRHVQTTDEMLSQILCCRNNNQIFNNILDSILTI
jgi:GMP synthase-like glutamine amidotransferase